MKKRRNAEKRMKVKSRQFGLTLMEMTVVIATVALLIAFGLPAVRTLLSSFESRAGTRAMISATLASARAIAAKQQHYAGIRFQNKYQQDNKGCQYMIFIVHDFDKTGLAPGFRAVEGIQPIKLPDSVGVMEVVDENTDIDNDDKLRDKTTFSIIFSPSGKLVIHSVLVINRQGRKYNNDSEDDIFNSESKAKDNISMFVQDRYFSIQGLGQEPSRSRFIIYDRTRLDEVNENRRYSDYLKDLDVIHINPYTGRMINK